MGSISSIGSQIPIPPSVNQNSASNPASDLNTQKNLAEATNAGSAASNTIGGIETDVKGIINNLVLEPPVVAKGS